MRSRLAAALGVVAIVVAGCGAGSSPTEEARGSISQADHVAERGGSLRLEVGDVVRVPWSSLHVAVLGIDDSRCPADGDVVCVWEGNVVTTLRIVADGGATEERRLEGIVENGQPAFGATPVTLFDLAEITVTAFHSDGTATLRFDGAD